MSNQLKLEALPMLPTASLGTNLAGCQVTIASLCPLASLTCPWLQPSVAARTNQLGAADHSVLPVHPAQLFT